MEMKAGTKFSYPRVKCPECGEVIAANWIIRHGCSSCARIKMTLEAWEKCVTLEEGRARKL